MAPPRSISFHLALWCALGLLAVGQRDAWGQPRGARTLRGVVADSSGAPIEAADVEIAALRQLVRTDDHGRFVFTNLSLGDVELAVRRIGYGPRTVRVTLAADRPDSTLITLVELPDMIAGLTASGRGGRAVIQQFYERRARRIGTFFTRDEILERHAVSLTDVLRAAPGVQVVRIPGGNGVRFSNSAARRNCPPLMWIDGQKAPGMEVDQVSLLDVEGIEVYQGSSTTPTQFWQNNTTTCGTIVIWTRLRGE